MSPDDKYSLLNRDNLMQRIQMQLSQKHNAVLQIFFAVSKSTLNFEHFQKKDDPHYWCISQITHTEKRGEIYV